MKNSIITSFQLFIILWLVSVLMARESIGKDHNSLINNSHRDNANPSVSVMNINNLAYWISKDGAYTTSGSPNSVQTDYPIFTGGLIYADGILWGAKISGDGIEQRVRVGGSYYYHGLKAGRVITDENGVVLGSHDPASNHVWRVRRDWETGDLSLDAANYYGHTSASDVTDDQVASVKEQYEYDWMNWPAPWGAPYEDVDGDGSYDSSIDIPGEPGADQTVWIVANDVQLVVSDGNDGLTLGDSLAYLPTSNSLFDSDPIGIELQIAMWAYALEADKPLGNTVFKRAKIIYTGLPNSPETAKIDTLYITQWSDPDLGNYTDDYVGCDSDLSLGYVYNGNRLDDVYNGIHNLPVPAGGFDLLQGPSDNLDIDNDGDSTEYLGMTSFTYFGAGSSISDPDLGDYEGSLQFFNLMEGFLPRPEYPVQIPWTDFSTGETTKFALSGDPVSGNGWIDGLQLPPGDRRLVMASGPFTMLRGDTAEVVLALIGSLGTDNIESVRKLKIDDEAVQLAYDSDYNLLGYDFEILSNVEGVSTSVRLNVYTSDSVTSVNAIFDTGTDMLISEDLQLNNDGYYSADIELSVSTIPYSIILSTTLSSGNTFTTEYLDQKITTWDPIRVANHEIIYDNLSNDGVLNIDDLANISLTIHNNDNNNPINNLTGSVISVSGPIEYYNSEYINFGSNIAPGDSSSCSTFDSYFTVKISDSAQAGDTVEIFLRFFDQPGNIWEDNIVIDIQPNDDISDYNSMENITGNADGSLSYRIVRPEEITGHSYEISFSEYIGENNRTASDCSGSNVSGYAMDSDGGTVDLYLQFHMACGSNWVDGIDYTFPSNFSMNINSWYFSDGNICSYGTGSGQNCNNLVGTLDGDVLSFGTSVVNGFGAFESSNTLVVNVEQWFSGDFEPIQIGYLIYDDGYDGNPVNAEGTFTIENFLLYPPNTLVMNVKNLDLDEFLLTTDTFPNEDGTNIDIIDGFKLFKGSVTYGKAIDFSDIIYDLNTDAISAYGEAVYNIDSYYANNWSTTAQATETFGTGIDSPGILGRDIQVRFTGEFVDQPTTTSTGIVYYAAQDSGGSYAWIEGARLSDLADHPDSSNPGDDTPFRIKIPFEVWDMEALDTDGLLIEGGDQIDIMIYDRKQTYNPGDTVYSFNPYDRMYTHYMHHAYQADGMYTSGPTGNPVDFLTWNVVWWETQFNQGDTLTFIYQNPISHEDTFVFTPETILSSGSDDILPESYSLSQNYPNPFNPVTNIKYSLPKNTMASVIIYNVLGQEVVKLIDKEMTRGNHIVQWDGKNNNGQLVGTGLYYYKLETNDYVKTRKMVLLK